MSGSNANGTASSSSEERQLFPNALDPSVLPQPNNGADNFLTAESANDSNIEEPPTTHEEDLAFLSNMDKKTAEDEARLASALSGGQTNELHAKPMQLMDDIRKADEKARREGRPIE